LLNQRHFIPVIENNHDSEPESDSESHQLMVSLLGFQRKLLGLDVADIVQPERKLLRLSSTSPLQVSETAEDIPSIPKARLIKQLLNGVAFKLSKHFGLFGTQFNLLYWFLSSVSLFQKRKDPGSKSRTGTSPRSFNCGKS
jgi:hypothetical protein